jgi:hypothetical protein
MADKERDYPRVKCRLANCTKTRASFDKTVYYAEPNGVDDRGNPVQVVNCTIRPRGLYVSMDEVRLCDSHKLMDAG